MASQRASVRARDPAFAERNVHFRKSFQRILSENPLSPLCEPQLLTAELAGGVPSIPTRKMKPLAPLQRRYIYWARANEMSFQAIADALGCAVNTTWCRIQTLRFNPVELLDCEFIQQNHTRNGVAAYFCRFCGYGAKTDVTVISHAYEHIFGAGSLSLAPSAEMAPSVLN